MANESQPLIFNYFTANSYRNFSLPCTVSVRKNQISTQMLKFFLCLNILIENKFNRYRRCFNIKETFIMNYNSRNLVRYKLQIYILQFNEATKNENIENSTQRLEKWKI